jgi:hypothetical protein
VQVLDLVHPSLFPLVDGLSLHCPRLVEARGDCKAKKQRVAEGSQAPWCTGPFGTWKSRMGKGQVFHFKSPQTPASGEQNAGQSASAMSYEELAYGSKRFQWLPADVHVDADGRVVFDSYVNNMHPEWHAPLYAATASLIEQAIPLFERTLATSAIQPARCATVPAPSEYSYPKKDEFREQQAAFYSWKAQSVLGDALPNIYNVDDVEPDGMESLEDETLREWPEPMWPDVYEPPQPPDVVLRSRTIQVR